MDLSGVRLHEGGGAAALAAEHGARALTYGSHVVLGRRAQDSNAVRHASLAHELVHVGQQVGPVPAARRGPGPRGPPAAAPVTLAPAGLGVQCQAEDHPSGSTAVAAPPGEALDGDVRPRQEVLQRPPQVRGPALDDVHGPAPVALLESIGAAALDQLSAAAAAAGSTGRPRTSSSRSVPGAGEDADTDTGTGDLRAGVSPDGGPGTSAPGDAAAALRAQADLLAVTVVSFAPAQVADAGATAWDPSSRDGDAAAAVLGAFLARLSGHVHVALDATAGVVQAVQAEAQRSTAAITASVEEQSAAVVASTAGLRGRVTGTAAAAASAVDGHYERALAEVSTTSSTARQDVESALDAAVSAVDACQRDQVAAIDEQYRLGDTQFRAVGRTVGDEALETGERMATSYMAGLVDEDDDVWDGPLTYNRGKARADTAREMTGGYRQGFVAEADDQADQGLRGRHRDLEAAATVARQSREALHAQWRTTRTTLDQAEAEAVRQAESARLELIGAVEQVSRGGRRALADQGSAVLENLRAAGAEQVAAVEHRAADRAASLDVQVTGAVAALVAAGTALAAQAHGQRAPPVEQLVPALVEAQSQLDLGLGQLLSLLDQGGSGLAAELATATAEVLTGLSAAVREGDAGAADLAGQVQSATASLGRSAASTMAGVVERHQATTAETAATATGGFAAAVIGVQHAYEEMTRGLGLGFEDARAGLEDGLRQALPPMEQEIRVRAEENAARVPPRWKNVLRWALIVAVVVVVALVVGPFVIGAVGAALGTGTLVTGIVAGAVVGAATSATIQVINNWAEDRPASEGVLRAAVIGAIGGAVGGGVGVWVGQLSQAGVAVANTAFRQFALNTVAGVVTETGIGAATGTLTWDTFGMSLITSLVVGGAFHVTSGARPVVGTQRWALGAGGRVGRRVVTVPSPRVPGTSAAAREGTRTASAPAVEPPSRPRTEAAEPSSAPLTQPAGETLPTGRLDVSDVPPGAPRPPARRLAGYTAEGTWDSATGRLATFTHGPLPDVPDVPVMHGRGTGLTEGEVLVSYADARRDPGGRNPATAAARGESGPYIRDNLYKGKAQTRAVSRLRAHGVLDVSPESGAVRVTDPDRYVQWLERAYRHHGSAHLDPRMRQALHDYVASAEPLPSLGTDPHTGGRSGGGALPGTHAELLAVNDLLVAGGGASPTHVATVRAKTGAHFAACMHCAGVLDRLPSSVQVLVPTGQATALPLTSGD